MTDRRQITLTWHTDISSPSTRRKSTYLHKYLDVLSVQVRDREVCIETDVFYPVCCLQVGEPFFDGTKRVQNIVVDVDLEAKDFPLLELRL